MKLEEVIDMATEAARAELETRGSIEQGVDVDSTAKIIGMNALKYADLSTHRESNITFSLKRMLALNGNTAPYLLYTMARIHSVLRKRSGTEAMTPIVIGHGITDDRERQLVFHLLTLEDVLVDLVEKHHCPHKV